MMPGMNGATGTSTYRTVRGELLDLTELRPAEIAFLERALELYREGTDSTAFSTFIYGGENPRLTSDRRFPDGVLWHPMIQALGDLLMRLSIAQGKTKLTAGDDVATDPIVLPP